jgi:hypothetical protein
VEYYDPAPDSSNGVGEVGEFEVDTPPEPGDEGMEELLKQLRGINNA